MSDIRIGLIGYGGWARAAFCPALKMDSRAHIISVAAPSAASREKVKKDLGTGVTIFNGFEDLLNGPGIDGVMIAVPDQLHEASLAAVLKSGVAVYYEPPVSDTRDHIPMMLEQLVRAEQVTHADLEFGFTPVILKASNMIQRGEIGSLQTVHIKLQSQWADIPGPDLCLTNHLAPWYVDALNCLVGKSPARVMVMDGFSQPGRRQNHSIAHFDYEGVWGTFEANINAVDELATNIAVTGDKGEIVIDYFNHIFSYRTRQTPSWISETVQPLMPIAGTWPGERECVTEFLDAIETGGENRTNGRMVAQLHLVGLAIEASRDMGTWVDVEDIQTIIDPPPLLAL